MLRSAHGEMKYESLYVYERPETLQQRFAERRVVYKMSIVMMRQTHPRQISLGSEMSLLFKSCCLCLIVFCFVFLSNDAIILSF